MNLMGFKWGSEYRSYEVGAIEENDVYKVACSNGEQYFLSEDYIITRVQKQILATIDDLGYAYEHQDWEEKGKLIRKLVVLRGYLVDE